MYWRPIRRSIASSPDWTGRWSASQTDGHSAIASISRSERSHGCEVTKRRRGIAGAPSAVRMPSMARISSARSGLPSRSSRRPAQRSVWTWREARLGREIVAIGVDVLAEQRDLPVAGGGEHPRLVDDLVERAAPLRPAAERHDAVGAGLVAAVDDRQPGADRGPAADRAAGDGVGPRRRRGDRRRRRPSARRRSSRRAVAHGRLRRGEPEAVDELRLLVRPQEQVDRRVAAREAGSVRLADRAAGHDHPQRGVRAPSSR